MSLHLAITSVRARWSGSSSKSHDRVYRRDSIAKRASLGLGRNGSISTNGSGDIFIAFSTAHKDVGTEEGGLYDLKMLGDSELTPLFGATVEATEEAVVNALVAAETMTGREGYTRPCAPACPPERDSAPL